MLHKHIHFSKLGNVILNHIEHFTGFTHIFEHCFPGLSKNKFQVFPGLYKLVVNDFPGYVY